VCDFKRSLSSEVKNYSIRFFISAIISFIGSGISKNRSLFSSGCFLFSEFLLIRFIGGRQETDFDIMIHHL
jgi:hypothetical protein